MASELSSTLVSGDGMAAILLSGMGTVVLSFILGLIRGGITDIKKHLTSQDVKMGELGERISRIEGHIDAPSGINIRA